MTRAAPVGIDIGGTGIKAGPVDLDKGTLLAPRSRAETPHPATPAAVVEVVRRAARRDRRRRARSGITLPSVVLHGVVKTAVEHRRVVDRHRRRRAVRRGDGPARRASSTTPTPRAWPRSATARARAQRGVVILVTLGTGIGSGLFVDGTLVPNSELGHLHLHHGDAEKWAAESARERDQLSWKEWAHRISNYLELVESLLWPDLFIIGGGVSRQADKFLPHGRVPDPRRPRPAAQRRGHRRRAPWSPRRARRDVRARRAGADRASRCGGDRRTGCSTSHHDATASTHAARAVRRRSRSRGAPRRRGRRLVPRLLEEPRHRRDAPAARRPRPRVHGAGASRRDVRRRARERLGGPRRAARGAAHAEGRVARRRRDRRRGRGPRGSSTQMADFCDRVRSGALDGAHRRADPRRREHRDRGLGPRARSWPTRRCAPTRRASSPSASSRTSTRRTSPRRSATSTRRRRCSSSPPRPSGRSRR